VRIEPGDWEQPQAVKLQPKFPLNQPTAHFNQVSFPERGVPFSPLND